jgi:uncharacterized Zn finger protein
MASPKCAKCGSTKITCLTKAFSNVTGLLVYCGDCGTVITWVPKPRD